MNMKVHHSYVLHFLFEIRADCLERWPRISADSMPTKVGRIDESCNEERSYFPVL